jgi:hypothetical protein
LLIEQPFGSKIFFAILLTILLTVNKNDRVLESFKKKPKPSSGAGFGFL